MDAENSERETPGTVMQGSSPEEPEVVAALAQTSSPFRIRWEWLAYAGVLVFALFSRFYMLADKPLHHDESLFAYYSYFLYRGWGYEYQPILHGPVLENVVALIFLVFGDNKFTMRLFAALGGLALLPIVWYWRRYLGRFGTISALVLIALSPCITYYSRFLRNDVPYMAMTCWCALCLVRAFDTGRRLYFWGAILTGTIMFCMMESSIFFFAACVGFLVTMTIVDWLQGSLSGSFGAERPPGNAVLFVPRLRDEDFRRPLSHRLISWFDIGLMALALEVTAGWFFYRMFYSTLHIYKPVLALADKLQLDLTPRRANWIIAVALYPLFAYCCAVLWINWRRPCGHKGVLHYVLRVCVKSRWAMIGAFSLGLAVFTVLFTTWFTHVKGEDFWHEKVLLTPLQLYKNTWDYWWDQHKLHRIKGPFHYYLPILFLYEFPAIVLVFWGWWRTMFRGRRGWLHLTAFAGAQLLLLVVYKARVLFGPPIDWNWVDKTLHLTGPGHFFLILFYIQVLTHFAGTMFLRRSFVESFLTYWTVTSLFAYSYAGEKVPWLAVHVAGPLALLAGLYTHRSLSEVNWTRGRRIAGWCAVCILLVWQFRTELLLNFVHPASPAERLVYNHTSPDLEFAVKRIERIAHETNYGKQMPLFVRGEMEWPLYWYFRDWTNATPPLGETSDMTSRPVVLVNWELSDVANLKSNYRIMRLKVREWWEPPLLDFSATCDIFRGLTPRESRRSGDNGSRFDIALTEWRKLWHYLAYRDIWLDTTDPNFSNGCNEFAFCIWKDLDDDYLQRDRLNEMAPQRDIPVYP